MADKKATREAYGAALATLGEKYDFLVLDADLAAATKTGMFKKKFPERFFDCGIAEGNMVTVAAGIAATGKKVFATSFAMFAAGRAYEQIRNSIGYPHLNVNIVGTHASITVGEDGATHQCSEDLALMRTIPGMTVICPADATEAYAAVEAVLNHDGPCYLRFGRYAVPDMTPEILPDYKFEIGKGVLYREGSDVSIIANGYMVHLALEAADILASEGISAEAVSDMLQVMADRLKNAMGTARLTRDIVFEKALYQASCKAAIKAGREYPPEYIEWVVARLMELPDITVCPHGRPVAMEISRGKINHQFERN